MDEQKNNDLAAEQLIQNAQHAQEETAAEATTAVRTDAVEQTEADGKIFKKYKIKDIVFLAIITACTLVTSAFMPLLVNVPCYGIIQMGLGLQFSLFPVIGMMKVRKPGALLFQSAFMGIFLVFMFPPMAFIVVCGLIAELLTLLIFRGYKSDWACVFAGTLYMPMTLPFMYLYYNVMYTVDGTEKAAVSMYIGGNASAGVIAGIVIAVIAICFVGSLLGMVISRELRKAGVLKN
ncbi:MAG: MptD family putative ECF transporter S component [Clostridia bacterium]|nr:MptD family putative ECF transporter S component [Clostridia bacterium]